MEPCNRILIVEDDKEILEGIRIYLKNQGYEVFGAGNGVEGLEVLEKETIHLAIVDVMMPRMDGITMTMKLREKYDFPVIMLTAMYLGSEAGFLTGAMAALLSNFYFGQGPWTAFQMLAWGLIGWIAGASFMQGFHEISAAHPVLMLWAMDFLTVLVIWGIGRLCAFRRESVPALRVAGNFLLIVIGWGVFQLTLFGVAQLRDAHLSSNNCTELIQKK